MVDQNKDQTSKKESRPNNYRPKTCLPITWKFLTIQIMKEIHNSLISRGILLEQEKGYQKGTSGTGEKNKTKKM